MVGEDSLKALAPILGASPRKVIAVRLRHPEKACLSMLVTLAGIVMLIRLVQLAKA